MHGAPEREGKGGEFAREQLVYPVWESIAVFCLESLCTLCTALHCALHSKRPHHKVPMRSVILQIGKTVIRCFGLYSNFKYSKLEQSYPQWSSQ